MTYARAGVSVTRGDRFVDAIAPLARATRRREIVSGIGGFAALMSIPRGYRSPLLVSGTDGVGTKVLLAREMGRYDTVGIDLVAMCVNDVLTVGAEPLFFLDYYATGKLSVSVGTDLVRGIARGCLQAGCSLIGGETAEMPQLYRKGEFDLAGFCVGVVERSQVIDGKNVRPGHVVLGLPSSGVHSNGYSLVRAILRRKKLSLRTTPKGFSRSLGETLLSPTRIYVKEVRALFSKVSIDAMAHITGGGIEGNLPRVLPKGTAAVIDRAAWKRPAVFRFLQETGEVSDAEMFRTFNMGIGFALVVAPKNVRIALKNVPGSRVIGEIVRTRGEPTVLWA